MSLYSDAGRPRWSNMHDGSSSNDYEDCSIDESLIEKLEMEQDTVMELMDDAEEKQFTNQRVKKWLVDVKHTIYDADTLRDQIDTEAKFYEEDGFSSSSTQNEFNLKATRKIRQITQKLVDLARVGKSRGLKTCVERRDAAAQQTQVPNARLTTSVLAESAVVHGREKEKEQIMKWVLSSQDAAASGNVKVDVIALIGMGGLGKTTLAKFVYNHSHVEGHFRRSWACVSDKLDLARVTKEILESLTKSHVDFCSLNTLQEELKKELDHGQKFLIVLDDVWESSSETMKNLMAPFSSGVQGSKIIITTRDWPIASAVSADYRCELKQMTEDESWSLFSKDVFQDGDLSQHPNLEVIGKGIVRKCGGLPLAIKTLCSLLRFERNETQWKRIRESSFWQLPEGKNDILPALGLSYSYLPPHLKACFAYCSLSPKDYQFWEEELVDLWIDEGFVKQSNDNTSIKDVGRTYFKELVSRSFFTKHDPCWYVMHDLIHDLAQVVFEDFHLLLDGHAVAKDCKKVRHVSFSFDGRECNGSINTEGLTQTRSLQSLVAWYSSWDPPRWDLDDKLLQDILLQQLSLRVLCLRGLKICTLPDEIRNLKLLRCLDVSYTDVEELPAWLCELRNLRRLLCESCDQLRELHMDMSGLVSLRHFAMGGQQLRNPPRNLSHLTECSVTLEFYIPYFAEPLLHREVGMDQVDGPDAGDRREGLVVVSQVEQADESVSRETRLERKNSLPSVEVEIDKSRFSYRVAEEDFASMDCSNLLESLRPHRDLKEVEIYGMVRFPDWLVVRSYNNIEKVRLIGCRLNSDSMTVLGQLPYLKILFLECVGNLKRLGRELYNCDDPFRSLVELSFHDMEEWEDWEPDDDDAAGVGKSLFPCLEKLRIQYCPRLKGRLPAHLPSLRELSIIGCPKLEALPEEGFPRSLTTLTLKGLDEFYFYLQNLTSLQRLWISKCPKLEALPKEGLPCSLTELTLHNLENLKTLDDDDDGISCLQSLTSLKKLEIRNWPKLEALPKEGLPCSLAKLTLRNLGNLKTLDNDDGISCLQNLTSLKKFSIWGCVELEALPKEGLPCSLAKLTLGNLWNLKTLDNDDGISCLQNLTSLKKLEICNCPKLEALPKEGLPCSLAKLTLGNLGNLKTLDNDDGISCLQNLTSLKKFSIWGCVELEALPKEGLPRSLEKLELRGEKLKEQCERDVGPYWPKIAHIPHIDISF